MMSKSSPPLLLLQGSVRVSGKSEENPTFSSMAEINLPIVELGGSVGIDIFNKC